MSDAFLLSQQEFTQQYNSLVGTVYSDTPWGQRPDAESAYALYLHYAVNGEGFQYFGRIKKDQDVAIGFDEAAYQQYEPGGHAFNPGTGIPRKSMNAGIIDNPRFIVGNSGDKVMLYLKRWGWTAALNDVWVLANVHARKDFYPISPLRYDYVFDGQFGVSVFGRELVGITLAGYIKKTVGPETDVFVPTHNASVPGKDKLSLVAYAGKMQQLSDAHISGKRIHVFREYFHSVGLNIQP